MNTKHTDNAEQKVISVTDAFASLKREHALTSYCSDPHFSGEGGIIYSNGFILFG